MEIQSSIGKIQNYMCIIFNFATICHFSICFKKGDSVAIITFYGEVFVFSNIVFSLTEMVIIKYLLMYNWSQMSMINDYLIANILHRTNVLISGILIVSRVILAEYMTNNYFLRLLKGSNGVDEQTFHHSITQWHPLIRCW